jgi:hypothetical protein
MSETNWERRLRALIALCPELAAHGIGVSLSDARPALSARHELTDPKLWIEIDASGDAFTWRRDGRDHHRIDDPAGAAARIAEYLKTRDTRPKRRGM